MLQKELNEHISVLQSLSSMQNRIDDIVDLLVNTIRRGNTVFICGNGGSAADAQHCAAEIVGRFKKERRAWPAVALTTDTSILTAISNDYGFDEIFVRQLEGLGRPKDVLLGISTSGNSLNVLKAVNRAESLNIQTIGLLGKDGGMLAKAVDLPLVIESFDTARIQEAHIFLIHYLVGRLEENIVEIQQNDYTGIMENRQSNYSSCSLEEAQKIVEDWRMLGQSIVFTNGCFDVLHSGHVSLLQRAKNLGNKLVVGLNTDASIKRIKGASRPILAGKERAAILGALSCVDLVVFFDDDTPVSLIEALRPDVLVKGSDYTENAVVGADLIRKWRGRVELLKLVGENSTTAIVDKIRGLETDTDY